MNEYKHINDCFLTLLINIKDYTFLAKMTIENPQK